MINVAVVGVGYWGPNLVRNLVQVNDLNIAVLCDLDQKKAEGLKKRFCQNAQLVQDYKEIVKERNVDAVIIATPIRTHFTLGEFFLSAGKHVFIEKPLAYTVRECQSLISLAKKNKCVLMVGHVFEYNAAVHKVKEYLVRNEIGKLFYICSQRVNLGRIQNDINALWSFAPHDISIINYWLEQEPVRVSSKGFSFLNTGIEDVVFLTLEYPDGVGVHLHLAWLDPRKIRLMTLIGSKKMLVYDDVSLDSKIQIYDKGIDRLDEFLKAPESFAEFQFQIRSGDVVIPTLQFSEPLQTECKHFVDCIKNGLRPLTDGENGLRVVRVLEGAEKSLKRDGQFIDLKSY
jgi:predicted dehydrogenase